MQERCDFFAGTSNCPIAPASYALSVQCNANKCFKDTVFGSSWRYQAICQETLDAKETEKSFQKKFCTEYSESPCGLYQSDKETSLFEECLHSIGSNKYFQCISIFPGEEVR